jgi:hypothetical protein
MSIVVTNRNSSATSIPVDGTLRSISGSGSITIGEDQLIRVLADNVQSLRFRPAGDLTHTAPAASGGPNVKPAPFSVTVDLTTGATVLVAPAQPGVQFGLDRIRVSATVDPGATDAAVRVGYGDAEFDDSDLITIGAAFVSPKSTRYAYTTSVGVGLTLHVGTPATGGPSSATFEIWGAYL